MGAGNYRHRVTIKEDTGTATDDHNERIPVWTETHKNYANIPAAIDTGGSRKFWAAKQVHSEMTHLVTIRWLRGLDHTAPLRLIWTADGRNDRTLTLLGPPTNPDGRNREYEFQCVEKTGE